MESDDSSAHLTRTTPTPHPRRSSRIRAAHPGCLAPRDVAERVQTPELDGDNVVKLSYRGQCAALAHDAYYYEFLRPLQGVSIARCYGYFTTQVPSSTSVVHCAGGDQGTASINNAPRRPYVGVKRDVPDPRVEKPDSDVEEIEETPDSMSILILERLGGYLPMGVPLSDSLMCVNSIFRQNSISGSANRTQTCRKDVTDIYEDLAHMHIWTSDIRYANILSAPPSPPGLPGRVCPIHNRVHEWRLVDFEDARETNICHQIHSTWMEGWLERILSHLPYGWYLNPEEDI